MRTLCFSINIPYWKIIHFESRKKVGESRPTCFDGLVHHDSLGRVTGESIRNFIGELNHYDCKGRCTGYSRQSGFATTTHFTSRGLVEGKTYSVLNFLFIHVDATK